MMLWIRRFHLYSGLFLFPWTLLFAVTAFLFNHPTTASEAPMKYFGRDATAGTALEAVPDPGEMAAKIVDELNDRQKPATPYKLADPKAAKFTREYAFATVKAEQQQVSVLVDLVSGGGTIRAVPPPPPKKEFEPAPFALGGAPAGPGTRRPAPNRVAEAARPEAPPRSGRVEGITLANPIHERMKAAIPTILEHESFPVGEVTVTSVPPMTFPIEVDGKVWTAIYYPMTGQVDGAPMDTRTEPLSVRSLLVKLHLAHGYPGSVGVRWFWAVSVDVMAAGLVFWVLSGLLMWWQLKSTRWLGILVLLVSVGVATALTVGMRYQG